MEYLDPNEIWKYRDIILSKINIVDIMTEYKIPLELKESGQFTHRAKCPFHSGKDGRIERTPSLYVSSKTNSFYCFGPCDAQGSLIDLICLMEGTSPSVALNKLAKKANVIIDGNNFAELQIDSYGIVDRFDPRKTIEPYLYDISFLLRQYIRTYVDHESFDSILFKFEKFAAKIDRAISKLEYGDWEKAEVLYNKVKLKIEAKI